MIVSGTRVYLESGRVERGPEWVKYEALGERIAGACSPLKKLFPDLPAKKLDDLSDVVFNDPSVSAALYWAASILRSELPSREATLDLALNVIAPKFKSVTEFAASRLVEFMSVAAERGWSAQERRTALERAVAGEDPRSIVFERMAADESDAIVREVMAAADLDAVAAKPALVNYWVGQVMRRSGGKAKPDDVRAKIEAMVAGRRTTAQEGYRANDY